MFSDPWADPFKVIDSVIFTVNVAAVSVDAIGQGSMKGSARGGATLDG